MKDIKQEEFEELIREIIEGKRSETSVIGELKTESRTFNNKVQELSLINPELYAKFIRVRPYKPKERKDINIRGFVIETLKSGLTVEEMCAKYGIGRRTISRKILALNKSDRVEDIQLYKLYKEIAYKRSRAQELGYEDIVQINELETEEVIGIDDIERRRQELLELEREYQYLCLQVGKKEAAKILGYSQNRIYKLLNELYRIEIERRTREEKDLPEKDAKAYRESMKVEGIKPIVTTNDQTENNKVRPTVQKNQESR